MKTASSQTGLSGRWRIRLATLILVLLALANSRLWTYVYSATQLPRRRIPYRYTRDDQMTPLCFVRPDMVTKDEILPWDVHPDPDIEHHNRQLLAAYLLPRRIVEPSVLGPGVVRMVEQLKDKFQQAPTEHGRRWTVVCIAPR